MSDYEYDSSDSGEDRIAAYQPALADKVSQLSSPAGRVRNASSSSNNLFPQNVGSVYENNLFEDGEVAEGTSPLARAAQARPFSSRKLDLQKNAAQQRRNERIQSQKMEPNPILQNQIESLQGPTVPLPGGSIRTEESAELSELLDDSAGPSESNAQKEKRQLNLKGLEYEYSPPDLYIESPRVLEPVPRASIPSVPTDPVSVRRFVQDPNSGAKGPIQCYIVRGKGSGKLYPIYSLYLEDGKRFLLAAKKRKKVPGSPSSYIISVDQNDLSKDSDGYLGKVRANFVGTEFVVYDQGERNRDENANAARQEIGGVTYQYNVLGTRGPRKMTALIPAVNPHTNERIFRPESDDDTLLDRYKSGRRLDEVVVMHNKSPRWNEELNAYCLNFNGRVTHASVKNFQLVTDDAQGHIILQFGKIGSDTFTMDFQWPITALQAFCICMTSFDNKLACE